jgi:putative peptide-modifying radical SAM enzyme
MFYHLFLTTSCNLACRYCSGEALEERVPFPFKFDLSLPDRFSKLEELRRFLKGDPDLTVIFYGGEPLLALEELRWVMDHVRARFILQTNGTLLHRLDRRHLSQLHTILLSIDGREKTTDYFRGRGTFRRVMENLQNLRGFGGEVVARMTVMEPVDIFEEVRWLATNEQFPFRSIHWQLNAGFWADFDQRDWVSWVEGSYAPGLRRLAEWWVGWMEEKGEVLKLYPLLGVAKSLLEGEHCWLRCGAGHCNYTIQTDGRIIPCPAMWGMRDYYLGSIETSNPCDLPKVFPSGPCSNCELLWVCGGRCLYATVTGKWGTSYSSVCRTVRELVQTILSVLPRIRRLLKEGRVEPEDFEYLKYNGCEIIP